MQRVVIVGGGIAGHQAALQLASDPDIETVLVGTEDCLPYTRPALSKELLRKSNAPAEFRLAGTEDYQSLGIEHRPATTICGIDRRAATAVAADGTALTYDKLLLATGSLPRRLRGIDEGVRPFYLRTWQEAIVLRHSIAKGIHLAIVGGGFIGLEVAAAARLAGCRVSVIEAAPRLLPRSAPNDISEWLLRMHEARGVRFFLGTEVIHVHARPAGGIIIETVAEAIEADEVLVGIGVVPNDGLARAAGLETDNGIVVDAHCRSSDPRIFAAGEVTQYPVGLTDDRRRVESWKFSLQQGIIAGRSMRGEPARVCEPPWLWSDQYQHNLQSLGFPDLGERSHRFGDLGKDSHTEIYLDDEEKVVGAFAVNRGRDISLLKRAMLQGGRLDRAMHERLCR